MAEGKCPECGRAFSKTAKFCQKCGHKLDDAKSVEDGDIKILNEDALAEAVGADEEGELFPFADTTPAADDDSAETDIPEAPEAPAASVPVVPAPTPAASPFTLEILNGSAVGRKVRLHAEQPMTVGSSSKADLTVDDSSVSRRHATFRVKDGQLYVKDEGSTNKTLICVDGEHPLVEGAQVILGSTVLRVVKE